MLVVNLQKVQNSGHSTKPPPNSRSPSLDVPNISQALDADIKRHTHGMSPVDLSPGWRCKDLHAITPGVQEERRYDIEEDVQDTAEALDTRAIPCVESALDPAIVEVVPGHGPHQGDDVEHYHDRGETYLQAEHIRTFGEFAVPLLRAGMCWICLGDIATQQF